MAWTHCPEGELIFAANKRGANGSGGGGEGKGDEGGGLCRSDLFGIQEGLDNLINAAATANEIQR